MCMKKQDFQIYGFPDGNNFEQLLDNFRPQVDGWVQWSRQGRDFLPWHTWHGNIHGIHRQVTSMFPRSQLFEARKSTVGYELEQFLLLSSGRIQKNAKL